MGRKLPCGSFNMFLTMFCFLNTLLCIAFYDTVSNIVFNGWRGGQLTLFPATGKIKFTLL